MIRIPFSEEMLGLVPDLCTRHPLRGADAAQLAGALLFQSEGADPLFATNDQKLLKAATAEGLQVFDPVEA